MPPGSGAISPTTQPYTTAPQAQAQAFATMAQPRGVVDLPIVGTKGAPKKFKGNSGDVRPFLEHYERLCAKHGVTKPKEKIESITQYCAKHVREFLEGLSSYQSSDYDVFKKDFKEFYNADKDSRRFRVRDLEKYIVESRKQSPMKDLHGWRKYARGFIRIGGWLESHQKITKEECAMYFWKGIPRRFRERLEHRLMSQSPTHDISKPFNIVDVEKVAKTLLQRDRFDHERLPSDSESDSSSDNESTDSESNSSDSESDSDANYKKKHKSNKKPKKPKKKKHVTFESDADSDSEKSDSDDAKTTHHKTKKAQKAVASKQEAEKDKEVQELIDQLGKMSLQDPSYAKIYFKAIKLDPIVGHFARQPVLAYEQTRAPRSPRGFSRDDPPHMNAGAGAGTGRMGDFPCYGCGESGHGVQACPRLLEMERQNIITRDARGRYRMANGDRIFRHTQNEPMTVAINRQQPTQANYVAYGMATCDSDFDEDDFNEAYPVRAPQGNAILESMSSESEQDYGYESSESEAEVYPIAEPVRQTRLARKEFEGVFVPGRKVHDKKIGRPDNATKGNKTPEEAPRRTKTTARPNFLTPQVPVEVNKPKQIDVNDSDVFMEDNFVQPKSKTELKRKADALLDPSRQEGAKRSAAHAPKNDGNATEREMGDKRQPRVSDL